MGTHKEKERERAHTASTHTHTHIHDYTNSMYTHTQNTNTPKCMHARTCTHTHTYTHTHMHEYTNSMHTHTQTVKHQHTYTQECMHTHTRTHARTHTHTHTHTHNSTLPQGSLQSTCCSSTTRAPPAQHDWQSSVSIRHTHQHLILISAETSTLFGRIQAALQRHSANQKTISMPLTETPPGC